MRILDLLPFKIEEQFRQKTYPLDTLRSHGAVQMNQEGFCICVSSQEADFKDQMVLLLYLV